MKVSSIVVTACLLFVAILTSCTTEGAEAAGKETYEVYFAADTGTFGESALQAETRVLSEEESPVEGLLHNLLRGPESEHLQAAIPQGVTVRQWSQKDGVLYVDFSGRYNSLSGIALTLADYSVTLTLSQVPNVKRVVITVEGEEIAYRDHQSFQADQAVLSIYRVGSMRRTVTLYFPREDGTGLEQEKRTLHFTEDTSPVLAVLQALAEGSEKAELREVLSASEILSAELRDGVCYLDLAVSFEELAAEELYTDQLTLYALVNTICELDQVEEVRIFSQGQPMTRYGAFWLPGALTAEDSLVLPS